MVQHSSVFTNLKVPVSLFVEIKHKSCVVWYVGNA